jgi:hypothetical protein
MLMRAMMLIKSNSSRWRREKGIAFSMPEGYGGFSLSWSNV